MWDCIGRIPWRKLRSENWSLLPALRREISRANFPMIGSEPGNDPNEKGQLRMSGICRTLATAWSVRLALCAVLTQVQGLARTIISDYRCQNLDLPVYADALLLVS